MEDFETIQPPSTALRSTAGSKDSTKVLGYATKVIDRILRSSGECDQALKERISKAVHAISQTRCTETAILHSQPTDSLRRLASRVIRQMDIRS